ncbi:hypothetical protein [Streptomyces sp. NBC_00847]|uniref:hypothetical protein n=1 Tax=unclassified Streptomyces TaxID=2593676 RepID=UPI00224E85B4|nr:hypothetical protein [Streptomyces sp. NBC_00847]MCX4878231.1 hypothetical protein [Streptomyces sp. NBC_00847]
MLLGRTEGSEGLRDGAGETRAPSLAAWNSGITVTTVAPGYIDTPINEALGDKRPFAQGGMQ